MHCIENKDNTQNKFTSELFCYILLVFMSTVAVWWENYIRALYWASLPSSEFRFVTVLLEIGRGGSIYTTETSKCYPYQGFVCFQGWLLNIYQNSTSVDRLELTEKTLPAWRPSNAPA